MSDKVNLIAAALAPLVPPPFNLLLAELAMVALAAPNPADAIERAKFYAAADAAKLAADELLRKELG